MLPGMRLATEPDRAFNLFNVQAIKTRTNPQVGGVVESSPRDQAVAALELRAEVNALKSEWYSGELKGSVAYAIDPFASYWCATGLLAQ